MSFMEQLNPVDRLAILTEDGCDPVTVIDLGTELSLSQLSDGGEDFHNAIIGMEQARQLKVILDRIFSE